MLPRSEILRLGILGLNLDLFKHNNIISFLHCSMQPKTGLVSILLLPLYSGGNRKNSRV